jgi:hypothetical protein
VELDTDVDVGGAAAVLDGATLDARLASMRATLGEPTL